MNDNTRPIYIQKLTDSVEIFDVCEIIGSKHNLHIDQVGELDAEIRGLLLGINKSEDFSKDIEKRLEVDEKTALEITKEANEALQVLIKKFSQPEETTPASPHSDLEKAGGFTIETENGQFANNTTMAGIGSDVLRVSQVKDRWAPVQQTIVPKGAPIPTPVQTPKPEPVVTRPIPTVKPAPVVAPTPIIPTPTPTVSIPTPVATTVPEQVKPITEPVTPTITQSTQAAPVPEQNVVGVSSTVLNPGSWPTKPKIDATPEKIDSPITNPIGSMSEKTNPIPEPIRPITEPVTSTITPPKISILTPEPLVPKQDLPDMEPAIKTVEPVPVIPPPPIPKIEVKKPEVETPKVKEPLADQLLSMLNKTKEEKVVGPTPIKKIPPTPPVNLPTEEIKKPDNSAGIKEAIEKAKNPEPKKEEAPAFNLDSYIKKSNTIVEPVKEPMIPKVTTPPIPIKIENTDPKPPPIPLTPTKPPTPPAPVPPPITVNPVKATTTAAPQPPKARGFDPYREPVQ